MKHFWLFAALIWMSTSLFLSAAVQFNESQVNVGSIPRNENFLTFNGPTELYFDFGGNQDVHSFGYYFLDENNVFLDKLIAGDSSTGLLGTFTENDRIGIWIKEKGRRPGIFTSTPVKSSNKSVQFIGTEHEVWVQDPVNSSLGELTIGEWLETNDGVEWEAKGFDINITSRTLDAPAESTPNGQPLPGEFSTLLLAMAAAGLYFLYEQHRKKTA